MVSTVETFWLEIGGNEGVQIGCNRSVPNLIQAKEAAAIIHAREGDDSDRGVFGGGGGDGAK